MQIENASLTDTALPASDWSRLKKESVERYATYVVFIYDDRALLCEVKGGIAGRQEFGLPGGGIRSGESAYDSLAREVFEEILESMDSTGGFVQIHKGPMRHFPDRLHGTNVIRGGKIASRKQMSLVFAANVPEDFTPQADGGEMAGVKWVTLEEAREMLEQEQIVPEVFHMIELALNPDTAVTSEDYPNSTDKLLSDEVFELHRQRLHEGKINTPCPDNILALVRSSLKEKLNAA